MDKSKRQAKCAMEKATPLWVGGSMAISLVIAIIKSYILEGIVNALEFRYDMRIFWALFRIQKNIISFGRMPFFGN